MHVSEICVKRIRVNQGLGVNHSWILTPWINIVGLKKVGLKYKSHGFNMYYGTHTVYHL